jgi:hypothetical protein
MTSNVFERMRCLHEEEASCQSIAKFALGCEAARLHELFATRRREFEFELTMRTSQGVDKANVKLDAHWGAQRRKLNEQFGYLYRLFWLSTDFMVTG